MGMHYNSKITTSGLVLHLDAANPKSYPGSGSTWYDLSGNAYNASIVGTNAYTAEHNGKFDYRGVSQVTDYIVLPSAAAQSTNGSYTLIYWIQPQAVGNRFFQSMHDGTNSNYHIMEITTTIRSYNGGSSISFTPNSFLQIALVRDGSDTASMYKNNENSVTSTLVDISTVTNGGWILNQEQDSVGGRFATDQNAYAAFSIVSLYDRALSQSEIAQNFNAIRGRYGI